METRRLKNIAILILLLLNAFLLLLLGYQELLGRRAEQGALDGVKTLFASEGLTLALEEDAPRKSLSALTLVRKMESEASVAEFLLGEATTACGEGGGIYSYTAQAGTVQFRSGGGFDTVRFSRAVEDAQDFVKRFCDKFGYEAVEGTLMDGTGSVTMTQHIAKVPVLGCTVTMTFDKNCLVFVGGAHIDLNDARVDSGEPLSHVSVLVRFFDFRRQEGAVCSVIRDVQCVYQLRSDANSPRLLPLWIVETDTYRYLVDGVSGEVTQG